jgi:ABC-type transport system, involved in lipoprotein release, permease component
MVKLRKIDIMLVRMIKNSKGQFLAVLTIIMIGICTYTALSMTSVNLNNTVETYYRENHFPDLFLQTSAVPTQEVDRLEGIDGVRSATGRIVMDVPFISDNRNERVNMRLITTKENEDELNRSTLLSGRELSDSGKEVLLIEQFANARGIKAGDKIKLQIRGVQQTFEVAGIVANPEYIYLMENSQSIMPDETHFGVCYISEKLGHQITGFSGNYNEILIGYENGVLKEKQKEDQLIDDVKDALDIYGVKFIIKRENQQSNSIINQELTQLNKMANTLPIIFLLVAGLILMMMLSRMVKKDRIKIGILKALGYSNGQVLFHYVKYAVTLGILGGIAGSVLGMALAGGMTRLYLDYFHIPLLRINFYYSYLGLAIILSAVFCTLSGIVGAKGVMKIAPADAMKTDVPKSGKRILLEKLPFFWRRLTFSGKMIAKNIFRNKRRTIFVVTGVTLTYSMMLFTTSMPGAMDQMMNKHFVEFQKMDYNITFQNPVYKGVANDLKHIIHVDYMEGKLEYPFELANGNKDQSVNIIGIPQDTKFYSFKDKTGKAVPVPGKGILLSENLANSLNVKKGDIVQVKSYLPDRDDVHLPVKGIIKQALGMNAYMDIDEMGEKLLEKNVITGVYVDSRDKNINEELIHASNIATVMSIADTRAVYKEYMATMILSIGVMVVFSGILGFCIVYNATIISVGEREMEFSSMRVLGFSKKEIFLMIIRENNIIMLTGILLGIPVGEIMAKYSSASFSTELYSIDMSPTLSAGLMAVLYTVGFIIIAQLATYRRINKLDFLQALKNREA